MGPLGFSENQWHLADLGVLTSLQNIGRVYFTSQTSWMKELVVWSPSNPEATSHESSAFDHLSRLK